MENKQMDLVKRSTPHQRAQIATQNAIISHQMKTGIRELPIDPEMKEEAQRQRTNPKSSGPGKGGRTKRRRSTKKSRKSRLSRRR